MSSRYFHQALEVSTWQWNSDSLYEALSKFKQIFLHTDCSHEGITEWATGKKKQRRKDISTGMTLAIFITSLSLTLLVTT